VVERLRVIAEMISEDDLKEAEKEAAQEALAKPNRPDTKQSRGASLLAMRINIRMFVDCQSVIASRLAPRLFA
jgi:hypothetical protein